MFVILLKILLVLSFIDRDPTVVLSLIFGLKSLKQITTPVTLSVLSFNIAWCKRFSTPYPRILFMFSSSES